MRNVTRFAPVSRDYWRIVLALAAKDILEALKNKTTLTMILGLALMMLTVQALPLLLQLDERPRVAIYDGAQSSIADELRRERTLQVVELRTAADALTAAQESSAPLLAVLLPADWENLAGALAVDGYVAHWVRAQAVADLVTQAEAAITAVTHRPVTIDAQTAYPTPESGGYATMVAMGLVLGILLITTILVPYLILEEKTAHTLDALRVSPASMNQMLLGKGLAGMVYGLLAAAVLLAFNLTLVNLWGLMLLAALALALFGVGLGLLIGTLIENEGTMQMWISFLAIALMFPLILVFVDSQRLPDWFWSVLAWLPSTAAYNLVRLSFGEAWSVSQVWLPVTAVSLAIALVFGLAGWRLRRWDAG